VESNVVVYLKIRNDDRLEWNRRYYPFVGRTSLHNDTPTTLVLKYDDEHNKEPYYTFEPGKKPQGTNLADARTKRPDPVEYPRKYVFGPFSRVFLPEDDNKKVAQQLDAVQKHLLDGRVVFIMGYGASGAGKTSTLVQLTRRGGSTTPGVLIEICNMLGTKGFTQLTASAMEFYMLDALTKNRVPSTGSLTFVYNSNSNGYLLTTQQDVTLNVKHPRVAKNGNEKVTFKAGVANLADILLHIVDSDRLVKATPNNPNSSRSHTLVFLTLTNDAKQTARLVVGDFAGVENAFDCSRWMDFAQIRRNGDPGQGLFYSSEVINGTQLDVRDTSEGSLQLGGPCTGATESHPPFSFSATEKEHEEWLGADGFSKLNQQLAPSRLGVAGWVGVIGRHWKDASIVQDVASVSAKVAFSAAQKNSVTHPALVQWSASHEELLQRYEVAKKAMSELQNWLDSIFQFLSTGLYQSVYGTVLLNNAIPKEHYLSFLEGTAPASNYISKKPQTQADAKTALKEKLVEYANNRERWGPYITYLRTKATELGDKFNVKKNGRYIWQIALDQHGVRLQKPAFDLLKYLINKTPLPPGHTGDTYATELNEATGVVTTANINEYFEVIKNYDTSVNRILGKWGVQESSLTPSVMEALGELLRAVSGRVDSRACRKKYLTQVCERRTAEGKYINQSLDRVREYIKWNIAKSNEGTIDTLPLFVEGCLKQYCRENDGNCFQLRGAGPQPPSSEIFDAISQEMNVKDPQELLICVFTVLNLSRSKVLDVPAVPYIDVNLLKRFEDRWHAASRDEKRAQEIQMEVARVYALVDGNKLLSPSFEEPFNMWKELVPAKVPFFTEERLDGLHKALRDIVHAVDNNNGITPIGTLEFADAVAKFSAVRASCQQARQDMPVELREWARPRVDDFDRLPRFDAFEKSIDNETSQLTGVPKSGASDKGGAGPDTDPPMSPPAKRPMLFHVKTNSRRR
jgi:hypothetical protein